LDESDKEYLKNLEIKIIKMERQYNIINIEHRLLPEILGAIPEDGKDAILAKFGGGDINVGINRLNQLKKEGMIPKHVMKFVDIKFDNIALLGAGDRAKGVELLNSLLDVGIEIREIKKYGIQNIIDALKAGVAVKDLKEFMTISPQDVIALGGGGLLLDRPSLAKGVAVLKQIDKDMTKAIKLVKEYGTTQSAVGDSFSAGVDAIRKFHKSVSAEDIKAIKAEIEEGKKREHGIEVGSFVGVKSGVTPEEGLDVLAIQSQRLIDLKSKESGQSSGSNRSPAGPASDTKQQSQEEQERVQFQGPTANAGLSGSARPAAPPPPSPTAAAGSSGSTRGTSSDAPSPSASAATPPTAPPPSPRPTTGSSRRAPFPNVPAPRNAPPVAPVGVSRRGGGVVPQSPEPATAPTPGSNPLDAFAGVTPSSPTNSTSNTPPASGILPTATPPGSEVANAGGMGGHPPEKEEHSEKILNMIADSELIKQGKGSGEVRGK
ncbi:MAG: hypothetical protein ACHP6I_03220, partial [Rickettsiales bacterium]